MTREPITKQHSEWCDGYGYFMGSFVLMMRGGDVAGDVENSSCRGFVKPFASRDVRSNTSGTSARLLQFWSLLTLILFR